MAGREKFAQRLASHTGLPVDVACPITQTGGTARQMGLGVAGGLLGAAVASKMGKQTGDLKIPQYAWLGLTATGFVISKANTMGRPTGDPVAIITYAEVADISVSEGKLTLRVDLELHDGRSVAFEAKRQGANKFIVEVIDVLRTRCST